MSEQMVPPQSDSPFAGMAANSRVDIGPGFLSYVQNFLVKDGELVGRRGLRKVGAMLPGGVQGIFQWQMLSGTSYTCVFADGDLHIYDWVANSFTTTDLALAGLTVSGASPIEACNSRGRMVLTDGTNRPSMITGPMTAPAYATLTVAPISKRCGIYYDKVFFWDIPGYENEFQWSFEGYPEDGYSPNDQAWEFAQTDAGRVIGMAPLNEKLIILKEDSATMMMGAADEDFRTLAVREGLSETEGTVAGGSVIVNQGDVFCVSVNGPRRIRSGQVYESLHKFNEVDYLRDIWETVDRSRMASIIGWLDRDQEHIGWVVPIVGRTDMDTALVYNVKGGSWFVFRFDGINITAAASVEDNVGDEWVMLGDDAGNVYRYRTDQVQYSDNGVAIERIARSRMMGGDTSHIEKRLVELHLQLYLDTDFEGEVRPVIDRETLPGRRFGIYGYRGRKRYRRGFNSNGYRVGWEVYGNGLNQTITITKASTFYTLMGLYADWKRG